jgi:two-component system cell cycle response regulator
MRNRCRRTWRQRRAQGGGDRCRYGSRGQIAANGSRAIIGEEGTATFEELRDTASALLAGAAEDDAVGRAPLPTRRSTPIQIASPQPSNSRRRILVVEDDAAIAITLSEGLEDEGYLVQQARDGREGVDCAMSNRPDLILLDVNLPLLDGFAAAARLRESSITRYVPIIFLSARRDLSPRVRFLQFENVDFISKPFSGDELLTRIEQALIGARAQQKLHHQAAVDELTGLGNLWMFRARLAEEHKQFSRYGGPLSLAMIDVDKLKSINDRHGHIAGSDALRAIADVLRRQVRTTDLAARYGGDEFVVLLPHTPAAEAAVFAERVRNKVAMMAVQDFHPTVSIGVASLSQPGSLETDDQLLRRADAAAYAAKRQGGNRICSEAALQRRTSL